MAIREIQIEQKVLEPISFSFFFFLFLFFESAFWSDLCYYLSFS